MRDHHLTRFIQTHSCQWSYQPTKGEWGIHHLDDPPHNKLLGPVFGRGEACGLIAIGGEIQCQWGDTHRADMTFSITKSYLALVMGVAYDHGLISDLDQTVSACLLEHGLSDSGFDDEHNRRVTWRQLLQFTSEWQGECFGVPDQIDRYRIAGVEPSSHNKRKGDARPLADPGSYWEYNDVRINQFSYALLRLWKRPLPEVFAEYIMQPLGASKSWHWHGYDNSWVVLDDGQRLQSVPGGGHWGGGMVISAHDQYLVAKLMLNHGQNAGRQLISADWIQQMITPVDIAPWYGYFTWLNTGHAISPTASESSYFAMGIGGQMVWHDPGKDRIVVLRWADFEYLQEIIERVGQAT